MIDVKCPVCPDRYHEINKNFNPNIAADGTMFVLKEPWASYGWSDFPKVDYVQFEGLMCPSCGSCYTDSEGKVALDCDMLWFVTKYNEAAAYIKDEDAISVNEQMDWLMAEYDPDHESVKLADPVAFATEKVESILKREPTKPEKEEKSSPKESVELTSDENNALDELPSVGQLASKMGRPRKKTPAQLALDEMEKKYICKHCGRGYAFSKTRTAHTPKCLKNQRAKAEAIIFRDANRKKEERAAIRKMKNKKSKRKAKRKVEARV